MRLDPGSGEPAAALVNRLPERELADLLFTYGEEPASRRIARAIVRRREVAPFRTTTDLARVVAGAAGAAREWRRRAPRDAHLPGPAHRRQRRAGRPRGGPPGGRGRPSRPAGAWW